MTHGIKSSLAADILAVDAIVFAAVAGKPGPARLSASEWDAGLGILRAALQDDRLDPKGETAFLLERVRRAWERGAENARVTERSVAD